MKKEYINTHETVKAIFEALNYNSSQIGAALNISAKAAQQKKTAVGYYKFSGKDFDKTLKFFDELIKTKNSLMEKFKDSSLL